MASKFNGFLDNLANGVLSPKGNMADWQHASRLYVVDNLKHAPKLGFLYHVTFYLTENAKSIIPEVDQYKHEIGMLVKSADLPGFTASVETLNKYNRKKNVQSRLDYNPINIAFHDDNYGATTALLEAYFKYYFADGKNSLSNGAYGNRRTGDTTYDGPGTNTFAFGMNNNTPAVPFFDRIEIAQMSRKGYTKYTLVNPIISAWSHDTVENSANSPLENTITLNYDTVFYDRGHVEAGENGNPAGFGRTDHYDSTPSPISPAGGGGSSFFGTGGVLAGASSTLGNLADGNLLGALITGANTVRNSRGLSLGGLVNELVNTGEDLVVNKIDNINFPDSSSDTTTQANQRLL